MKSSSRVVSLTGLRSLPHAGRDLESLVTVCPPIRWIVQSPRAVFGEKDHNYLQVLAAFKSSRACVSVPVYVGFLRNALISPQGLVFGESGDLIYESVFPWQIENITSQFSNDVEVEGSTVTARLPQSELIEQLDDAVHCREGGEVGYFHFINSILPKLAIYKRMIFGSSVPLLASTYTSFAKELFSGLGITVISPNAVWRRVKNLRFISPFTFQGDHFTRSPYSSELISEVLAPIMPTKRGAGRRIYLARGDVSIRRIVNEDEILEILKAYDFEVLTVGSMPISEQIKLFSDCEFLVSAHGAGLSNLVFTPMGSRVLEFVSPARLWPTFRMLSARHHRSYAAVIGSDFLKEQTSEKSPGNEDFVCDPEMVRAAMRELLCQ